MCTRHTLNFWKREKFTHSHHSFLSNGECGWWPEAVLTELGCFLRVFIRPIKGRFVRMFAPRCVFSYLTGCIVLLKLSGWGGKSQNKWLVWVVDNCEVRGINGVTCFFPFRNAMDLVDTGLCSVPFRWSFTPKPKPKNGKYNHFAG